MMIKMFNDEVKTTEWKASVHGKSCLLYTDKKDEAMKMATEIYGTEVKIKRTGKKVYKSGSHE
jgi:hypothetical protein